MKQIKSILLVAIITLAACSKNDNVDTTKPTIEVITPANEQEYHPGEAIDFKAIFTDDVALKSYKIAIHYNGDGHDHTKSATTEELEWTYEQGWELDSDSTKITVEHSEIVIPDDAKHGEYHFGVYCLDLAGNEHSVFVAIDIEDEH